jgi:hypothetical protein
MKLECIHKRLIIETAVAAGLALSGMQLDTRCISAVTSSPVPVTGMIPTRFKDT